MTLDKNKTISAIGRRMRLRNHDMQRVLEALIEVWTDELASGGRIEIQKFLVLEVKQVDRGKNAGRLLLGGKLHRAPRAFHRLVAKPSKRLRTRLRAVR